MVASPEYRRDAAERLAALVDHLEEKFGPHVAGYHPCGQNTGEWFYQETWGHGAQRLRPGRPAAWREWLKRALCDDAALQRGLARPACDTRRRRSAHARGTPCRARRRAPRSGRPSGR